MRLHSLIANLVTRRRGAVWIAIALLCAASVYILVTRMKLDSEVLNLLPSGFESVEGLKVYNRDFAQVRDLTFALFASRGHRQLEEFAPQLHEKLREQPLVHAAFSPACPSKRRKAFAICNRSLFRCS